MASTQGNGATGGRTESANRLARMKSMLATDPTNARLARDCTDLALASGDFAFVLERATAALAATPQDARALFDRASALIGKRAFREAAHSLRQVLELMPALNAAQINLGLCAYMLGEYAEARETLEKAYQAGDRSPDLLRLIVSSCHHLALVEEAIAIADANPLPAQSTATPAALGALAGVYALLYLDGDKPKQAAECAARALAADPDSINGLITRATLDSAGMQVSRARQLYLRVLELAPTNGRAWVGLGTLSLLDQDFPRAKEQLTRGVEHVSRHTGSWLVLAWTHLLSNDFDAAESTLAHALELDRNFAETHGALAAVLALRGDRAGAEREVEIAQRLDPQGLSAQFARSVLITAAGDPAAARRLIQESARVLAAGGQGGALSRMLVRAARR